MSEKIKVGIYYRDTNPQEELEKKLIKLFPQYGMVFDNENPDVVIHIGGDGTFLRAVHHYLNRIEKTKFLGIKAGTLGYFYEFNDDHLEKILKMVQDQDYKTDEYPLLKGDIAFKNEKKTIYAINEMRIESPFRTLICDVSINGELLEKFRGNGLNVSTSIGSTAYNKSLKGAIVEPHLPLIQLCEIAPISNNIYRSLGSPMVLNGKDVVTFNSDFSSVLLGYDFQDIDVKDALKIDITLSNRKVVIIRGADYSYIQTIRRSFIK